MAVSVWSVVPGMVQYIPWYVIGYSGYSTTVHVAGMRGTNKDILMRYFGMVLVISS